MSATKELERLREICRRATCQIEVWIEQRESVGQLSPAEQRHVKRVDKAVFAMKIGMKILKRANKKLRKVAPA